VICPGFKTSKAVLDYDTSRSEPTALASGFSNINYPSANAVGSDP